MPGGNIRDLRRRVKSVSNIQQITRAMKFVSAARLRKAQERMFAARPYATRMMAVLNSMATRVDPETHPLLKERKIEKTMLLVFTADKGLCGGFNSNLIKSAVQFINDEELGDALSLTLVGKKGAEWFRKRPWPIKHQYLNVMSRVDFARAREIAETVTKYYVEGEVDAVYLLYNQFKSVIAQTITLEPLLPVQKLDTDNADETMLDYIYEQPAEKIFDHLLPKHIETQIFRAMLESEASEQGSRMTAMDAATNNAEEMIESITLHVNRVRQASITTELIEIVSGANALQESRSE
ncbi:MAG: ATP synthase F1 subunit gamma [Acidobacteriota bacterium]